MEIESATNLSRFRPHVKLSGAASLFAAESEPVVILIQQGPGEYLVQVALPGPARHLNGLAFLVEGDRTMHIEGTVDNVDQQLTSSSLSPASRLRRLYPPAFFGISFDFPEQIVSKIFSPRRRLDGIFEFTVFKAPELQLP